MLVLYYFQGEYVESMENPNAFMIQQDRDVTYGQFLDHFPFPGSLDSMHFRFRVADDQHQYVWFDVLHHEEKLPVFEGVIFVKVLRLDHVVQARRKFILRRKAAQSSSSSSSTNRVPANSSSLSSSSQKLPPKSAPADPPAVSPSNGSGKAPKPTPVPAAPKPTPSLIDEDDVSPPFTATAPVPASAPNLFDDSTPYSPPKSATGVSTGSAKYSSSVSANDIDEDPVMPMTAPAMPEPVLNRVELAANREENIANKVQAALKFKQEMDSKAAMEMQGFDAAREKHEKALVAWATNPNKEKRNVRNLLSTMHTVLPSGTKWKALGLGDLLEPIQVKKAYRKAMLVVHPDHTGGMDSESKFICKRIFEAVNEAYDEFTKKESV